MIFKKISAMIAVVAASLLMPSASFADDYQAQFWDYIGSSTFTDQSSVAKSSGGSFKFTFKSASTAVNGTYWLWEEDPDGFQYVGKVTVKDGGGGEFYNVGGFVDGSNNRAEFVLTKDNSQQTTVNFYNFST
ncbi:hypothetical protein SAMN05444487_102231 [Marininema mesophilum]|uniref:Uncharacterized protein n=1 Tax=Marininema mesophilum TaxID=1048340 RepID=A0A1H2SIS1_9BACL|nr:hypothetical protein [Marininema mesophilum]SDW31472.1 hypothetical protein SAMN05444487_102231 [Marininema mesophilum]